MTPSWIGQSRDWSVVLGPIFYILISRENAEMDSRRSSTGQSSNAQSAIDPTRLKSSWESDVTVLYYLFRVHKVKIE